MELEGGISRKGKQGKMGDREARDRPLLGPGMHRSVMA